MKTSGSHRFTVLVVCFAVILVGDSAARADFTFGKPQNLGPIVNSPYYDNHPSISADGLALHFDSYRPARPPQPPDR